MCVYPELITRSEHFPVSVELKGEYTRSMMVVDRMRNSDLADPILPNSATSELILDVNMEKANRLMELKFY